MSLSVSLSILLILFLSLEKNVASLQFGAKRNSGIFVTDEKRSMLERQAQFSTTNEVNNKMPFNTGLLVNRIFANQINGDQCDARKLRDEIERNSATDKYASMAPDQTEKDLKEKAVRKSTDK